MSMNIVCLPAISVIIAILFDTMPFYSSLPTWLALAILNHGYPVPETGHGLKCSTVDVIYNALKGTLLGNPPLHSCQKNRRRRDCVQTYVQPHDEPRL